MRNLRHLPSMLILSLLPPFHNDVHHLPYPFHFLLDCQTQLGRINATPNVSRDARARSEDLRDTGSVFVAGVRGTEGR